MCSLEVVDTVTGKFGTIINGTYNNVYFKAFISDLENKMAMIHEIETSGSKSEIKLALIKAGLADF